MEKEEKLDVRILKERREIWRGKVVECPIGLARSPAGYYSFLFY